MTDASRPLETEPATDEPTAREPRGDDAAADSSAPSVDGDGEAGATADEAPMPDPAAGDPAAAPLLPDEDPQTAQVAETDLTELAAADPRDRVELLRELQDAVAKRDEYLDDLRRSHADFENYRRRTLRESAAQRELGKGDAVEALLEVLDDLDRTLDAAQESTDEGLAKGIELVAGKLVTALQGLGLVRIDATDVIFDPTEHDAVQQRPAEDPRDEPVVVQVLRPGYRLGDRMLRAAMVVVEQ